MAKFTKRYLESIEPQEKLLMLWDSELTGFGLIIMPSGIKSYFLQYRNIYNKTKRLTLGRFTVLSLDSARAMALEALNQVSRGQDPQADKRRRRHAENLAVLLEQYLKEHVQKHNSPKTQKLNESIVKRLIIPALGSAKLENINRQDIRRFHNSLSKTPRQANQALSVLSKAFQLAEEWGMRPEYTNPCRGIKKFQEVARERFLSDEELTQLGQALKLAEIEGLPWPVKEEQKPSKHLAKIENQRTIIDSTLLQFIRMLIYTGARLSEMLTLKWSDVNFSRDEIALPSRKGAQRVPHPVSASAMDILRALQSNTNSPWVFPRRLDPSRHISIEVVENAWQRLRTYCNFQDVRLHDLRHTFGTFAAQTGSNSFIVRDSLRHKTMAMSARYANFDKNPVRQLSEDVSSRIDTALGKI